nr:M15 family metallopeptidase [uncultured Tyzzerella sp.]
MSRDITLLHPDVQHIIPNFLEECKKQGLIVKITDTLRTKNEQDNLYAQGRTKPGKIVTWVKYPYSNHNWGMAFDICRNDGKGAYNDNDGWFKKVGKIGKKFGLDWGGDWKNTPDKPHFELTKYGNTNTLIKKYTLPENFKKTWINEEKKYMFVNRNYSYNGKIKCLNVINEKGENYVKIRDLAELLNKNIKYDNETKITILDDIIENVKVLVNNKEHIIKSVKINDFNFMNTRELANVLGYETGYNETLQKIYFTLKNSIIHKLNFIKGR